MTAEEKKILICCELHRRAYQAAQMAMFAAGGRLSKFAIDHMPCGNGPLERAIERLLTPEEVKDLRAKAWEWYEAMPKRKTKTQS